MGRVSGFPKAEFKSFISKQEADDWLKEIKSSNENRRKSYSVIVYTDGGSRNHGNKKGEHVKKNDKAAWAYLIKYQGSIISDTDGEYGSTNNRMEIMALKKALLDLKQRELQNEKILVVLDSITSGKGCIGCGNCVKACIHNARKMVGKLLRELVLRIRNYGWKLADYCQNFQI